ncbi:MAG: D-alanyl-D-alanine carboxypeptidase [Erysipelotrichaceae bacterium]|nr:D-alanyl-D-alanine carboxypeptidase [Erysipelotrichaceae bacterium]
MLCSCQKNLRTYDPSEINVLDDKAEILPFGVHSYGYLLVDLTDFDILYSDHNNEKIYPASLTKVLTMDTVLSLFEDLDDTSFVTYEQVEAMIREDASLAYIRRDYVYSLRDLLYALILPSGADAAVALENYFKMHGLDLVDEMNKHALELGCTSSHFMNTTGLHDDNHYSSLDDLYLIVMDTLNYKEGRKVLTSLEYEMEDGQMMYSSVGNVLNHDTQVLGGKTGYTPEAGQNILVLYRYHNKPYLLLTCGAPGSLAERKFYHYEDALEIFGKLY